jgi:glutamine---fructose-6-phosphate transaminase (isomerizing)
MCGIVGYLGPKEPKDVILEGLKRLEYRGYDSAGVAIFDQGQYRRIRAHGKLNNLGEKLKNEKFNGHIGIGHTRWATHGVPSEQNAHPHKVKKVSIVHNGIIENYQQIRADLKDNGAKLESETDSELVAHLISDEVEKGTDLLTSVRKIIPKLHGAYAVLAVCDTDPENLVAFKDGPPLILGIGKDELILASDLQAIVPFTNRVIFLEDGEIISVKGKAYQFFTFEGAPVQKEIETVDWNAQKAEKGGHPHFMLKEILEQPRAVATAMAPHIDLKTRSVNLGEIELKNLDHILKSAAKIHVIGCGTSYYAGCVGKYVIEKYANVPVECDIASEFRYRNPIIIRDSVVILISQSGETADTLEVLRKMKAINVPTISICNVKNSTIDRESDGSLYMNAGPEIGVASTKAFTSTLVVLELFAMYAGRVRGYMERDNEETLVTAMLGLPSQMEIIINYSKFFAAAAKSLKTYRGFLFMGRGINYPIALEGALKLKELCYMHAEGYAAGEMKHGPLALIDKTMAVIMIAPKDELYEKTVSNLEEARARGGQIISIGTGDDKKLASLSVHYLSLPEANWLVNPILAVMPLQLMAYHLAVAMGHDVDQPRNLAKSVTVE